MRILIQRVKHASVTIDGKLHSSIGKGFLALVGFCQEDVEAYLEPMAEKMTGLRIFTDDEDKMNLALKDVDGELLAVSQFTLYADCKKGKRPSFVGAKNLMKLKCFTKNLLIFVHKSLGKKLKPGYLEQI